MRKCSSLRWWLPAEHLAAYLRAVSGGHPDHGALRIEPTHVGRDRCARRGLRYQQRDEARELWDERDFTAPGGIVLKPDRDGCARVGEDHIRGPVPRVPLAMAVEGSPVATRVWTPRHKRLIAPVGP